MANLHVKDGAGADVYIKGAGAQTDLDPFVPDPIVTNAVIGAATSDAAVVTDATGTIHQYLRGLVKLIVAKITVALDAGTNLIGKVSIDQVTANANEVVLKAGLAAIGSVKDNGPAQTIVRTYTASADMTTAAALTAAPTGGQKIVAVDALISSDTDMAFDLEMETSANVLAKFHLTAYSPIQISARGYLKGDAADKKIFGKASVAGNVAVTLVYFSEA